MTASNFLRRPSNPTKSSGVGVALTIAVASCLIALLLPERASSENGDTMSGNAPVRARDATPPASALRLGGTADENATRELRKRRLSSLVRELSHRGFTLSEAQLQALVAKGPGAIVEPGFGIVEPEAQFFIEPILGGDPTTALLSVGMLLGGVSDETTTSICTVTLTKPDTIVTARHCLAYPHNNETFWVYFPYGGIRLVLLESVSLYCSDNSEDCSITMDDLAFAKLATPYAFLPPSLVGEASTAVDGQGAKIVGYGLDNPDLADYGIKREAKIRLSSCNLFPADGLSLCFDHSQEVNDGTGDSTVVAHAACNNDSGGPMLTPGIHWDRMIGVASQMAGSCSGNGEARYVNMTNIDYMSWLSDAYCDPTCETDPDIVLSELLEVNIAFLDEAETRAAHPFAVPEATSSLIVTLNHSRGWFPYVNDLNLELPAELNPICKRFIEVEECVVNDPPAGDYTATVTRFDGVGVYQLTAVALTQQSDSDTD